MLHDTTEGERLDRGVYTMYGMNRTKTTAPATDVGLYCERGGFLSIPAAGRSRHCDPCTCRPSLPGMRQLPLARRMAFSSHGRLDENAAITDGPYGEPLEINGVRVSLHPAGHILGSAQIRLEHEESLGCLG